MTTISKLIRVAGVPLPSLDEFSDRLADAPLRELRNPHPEGPVSASVRSQAAEAGVLLPVIWSAQPELLVTRRSRQIRFGGDVCFPGGRHATSDTDLVATALRETTEETGIAADQVKVLGRLGHYYTQAGYHITAVIGILDEFPRLQLDPAEVEDAFTVPLERVLQRDSYAVNWRSQDRGHIAFHHGDIRIAGPTVSLMVGLLESLGGRYS